MNRTRFTIMVILLTQYVRFATSYDPILDYVKRSAHEQAWLFKKKFSKRNGHCRTSRHQFGKAVDLYLVKKGKVIKKRAPYIKMHKFWDLLGGKPIIKWDLAHFEV